MNERTVLQHAEDDSASYTITAEIIPNGALWVRTEAIFRGALRDREPEFQTTFLLPSEAQRLHAAMSAHPAFRPEDVPPPLPEPPWDYDAMPEDDPWTC